ncbi:hypothetical protein BRAS3809_1320003 [Bradyrhizobium sp. STM 3809]|nr:hypothetical protein BRAS3809_1320003 [Bradyrhizobium sp. STM 3809]
MPGLAWEASRKPQLYPTFAVQRLVHYCGPLFLERCLGPLKKRLLLSRYRSPKRAAVV